MAVTIVSFRWLEILEKEFDKNFVDLDLIIGELDSEEPDFVHSARQKLAGLSSCFAQLTHKAQTIFQNSAKVEAELVDLRTELVNSKTRQEVLEEESRNLVLQLHSLQLDRLPSNQNPEQYKEKIETALKLSPSKSSYSDEIAFRNNSEVKKLKNELLQYQKENIILRNSILALHSEVYGARLAAKYLDKELAGRIQQLQLLGKEMRTDVRDRLWRQLESEILLHRHKTVIRACRNRTNHEFIPSDSRILDFNRSDRRHLKSERFLLGSGEDSFLKFEGTTNRRKEFETIKKKSDSNAKLQSDESKNENNVNDNSINGGSNKGKNNDDDNHNINNNNNSNSNNNNSDCVDEKTMRQNDFNQGKSNNNKGNLINAGGKINALSESFKSDSGHKMKFADVENMREKSEFESSEKGEEKTEEKKTDGGKSGKRKDSKGIIERKKKSVSSDGEDFSSPTGEKRDVIVKRQSGQGLGISITGGREHGVPILISELEVGGPAFECRNLFVGDAILRVNDVSLENASHFEAVKTLTNLDSNSVKLQVQFIAVDTDEENSLSEDLYGYRYRFFDTEVMDSSDALGLHPLHSKSAHTPTAPRTPDLNARIETDMVNRCRSRNKFQNPPRRFSASDEFFVFQKKMEPETDSVENAENSMGIDSGTALGEGREKLKIDLFGFRFQTDIEEMAIGIGNPMDDFSVVKTVETAKPEADLIRLEEVDGGTESSLPEKKFEYVDENIFSGLEDHSILDNIMKSFSEEEFSFSLADAEREKNVTSDSGLEVCLSGSENEGGKPEVKPEVKPDGKPEDEDRSPNWMDRFPPEKVELKTLQQIFDRSFSSNLSSPRGSTSFDDDILSTEHSDEKSNSASDPRDRGKEGRNGGCSSCKKIQRGFPKSGEDIPRKPSAKSEAATTSLKSEIGSGKKIKRIQSDGVKRSKSARKSKEIKAEKRKNIKESEAEMQQQQQNTLQQRKREVNFKMTDRFEENLIEYNVKSFGREVNPPYQKKTENRSQEPEVGKKAEAIGDEGVDELEETRKLSRKYGLKIPGKGVKADSPGSLVLPTEVKSPDTGMKPLESHFRHFKPVLDGGPLKQTDRESKSKLFRCSRYESFGDPDFGTPV